MPKPNLHSFCEAEIANLSAILEIADNSRYAKHGPTLDYYRGALGMLQRIANAIDLTNAPRYGRIELLQKYVELRSDGWKCIPFGESDIWERCILSKGDKIVEINLLSGTYSEDSNH